MNDLIHLPLSIECDADISPEEIHHLMEMLYRELRQTPIDEIHWRQAPPPPGAKGGSAFTPELIVALSVGLLPNVLIFLQKWLLRQREQVVKIKMPGLEIEIPRDMPPGELVALIEKMRMISRSNTSE